MKYRNIQYLIIAIVIVGLGYILFSSPSKKSKDSYSNENGTKEYRSGKEALNIDIDEKSLFEANNGFLNFSNVEEEQKSNQPDYFDPAGISYEEREKRKKLVIEKYKELTKIFPNNRYIPREYSSKEKAENDRRDANMNYLQERILSNENLTPTESAYFYSNKLNEIQEKLEIINYSIDKLTESRSLNEKSKTILDERIASIQSRNNIYSEELKSAISKGGNSADYDTKD